MANNIFPNGVTANIFLLVILSELLCLIVTLTCTILGLINLIKNPNRLKGLVWGIFLSFSLTIVFLVGSELSWWFSIIQSVDQFNLWNQTIPAIIILLNVIFVWTFQVEVFVAKGKDQMRNNLIFDIIVILIAIGFFTSILTLQEFSGLLILLVLIEYGIIIRRSFHVANMLKEEKINHNHMVLLGVSATIMILSYILTVINSLLNILIPPYSFLYHIAAWFGAIAIVIWFLAFFTPDWLLKKWKNANL
jgi:hypothetical protein